MKKQRLSKKLIVAALTAVLSLSMFAGCQSQQDTAEDTEIRSVTDADGNVVEVPMDLDRIAVVPLPWASVVYAIAETSGRLDTIHPGAMSAYQGSYLEILDKNYGNLDTTCIGSDFSMNFEELVQRQVQACVIWDYQTEEAEKLREVGITPVMVKNATVEELQSSLKAIGQMLGKEERAQRFIDLYGETYERIQSYSDAVEKADKPKVLYLRDRQLALQGNDNFIKEALALAGADNVAADVTEITMEEIIKLDPDIILLSNFDDFTPEDLYKNKIEGQDWSTVKAVREKAVYKVPMGIYRWDAPGVETPLMMLWLAQLIQPNIFSDVDMEKEVQAYFETYFDVSPSASDIALILQQKANQNSK